MVQMCDKAIGILREAYHALSLLARAEAGLNEVNAIARAYRAGLPLVEIYEEQPVLHNRLAEGLTNLHELVRLWRFDYEWPDTTAYIDPARLALDSVLEMVQDQSDLCTPDWWVTFINHNEFSG